jgi:predicted nuclease of predicted toxin-antitoxin system
LKLVSGLLRADRPTISLDRRLGNKVAAELRAAGPLVAIHADHFAQEAADVDWISEVFKRGRVILTKDKNVRRRPTVLAGDRCDASHPLSGV